MPIFQVSRFENSFTIHFGSEHPRISAYTLASALTGIADAARAANATINPGFEIEVVVEALGQGSFKATLRAIYSEVGNLFSKETLRTIVLAVIANFVYQHTLAPDSNVQIDVGENEVVITQGDTTIVVPRDVHDATKEVESSPEFKKGIGDAVRAIETDRASLISD